MIQYENNPVKEVLDAIEEVTHLDATLVFLDEEAAGKDAAYGAQDEDEKIYICLNTGTPFNKMLSSMAMVAAGYAAEKKEKLTQKEVFEQITAELLRREAAKNE